MGKTTINELVSLVGRLQTEREAHVNAISTIDEAFSKLGMEASGVSRPRVGRPPGSGKKAVAKARRGPGRPPGSKSAGAKPAGKKRKARRFKTTANDLIMSLVKKTGAKGVSSGDIKRRWAAAGRPGEPYNTLGELVRSKKIVRKEIKGERGSRYAIS
ncbi:MAG: hypothetical protein GXP29_13270 [Planctomycetes bacterium]|nr:hypothetical protein [Planctomycetota bacterium]